MIAWDNVRYFLAVAQGGSVRAAAGSLGVNHSTVLRRIAQLESDLGTRMFDKQPSGYRLTDAGEEILELAERMEASSNQLEARVFGRERGGVRGLLRVTSAPLIVTHLLVPDVAEFAQLHPEVEVELLSVDQPVNLTNRAADVAVRVVYDRANLPENLHGLKGPEVFGCVYLSRDLLAEFRSGEVKQTRWIVKNNIGIAEWAREIDVITADVPFRTTQADAQIAAVREGMGLAALPCFVGDADPQLIRAPGSRPHLHGTLWLLTHGETRKSKRVRLFTDHLSRKFASYASRLAGTPHP